MASVGQAAVEDLDMDHHIDEEDMDEDVDYYNDFADNDLEQEELGDPESFVYELLKVGY